MDVFIRTQNEKYLSEIYMSNIYQKKHLSEIFICNIYLKYDILGYLDECMRRLSSNRILTSLLILYNHVSSEIFHNIDVSSESNIYPNIITRLHDVNLRMMFNFFWEKKSTLYNWKGHNETLCKIFMSFRYMIWWIWMILKNYVYLCICIYYRLTDGRNNISDKKCFKSKIFWYQERG